MEDLKNCYGRLFVQSQLTPQLREKARTLPAMKMVKKQLLCSRCGSQIDQHNCYLPINAYYCRHCINLGRVRSDQELYYFPQKEFPPQEALIWQGQLTPWQTKVSAAICQAVREQKDCLVHAVTGAGKTEMVYQVIADQLVLGRAVCLASPRIDVCIELHSRMSQAFDCPIALLHGEGTPYFRTPLVIATTHQLLKFYQAFNLLIIDEVDAFPFVDNAILYHAAETCLKLNGRKIFLTATSTDELDRQVRQGLLKLLRLPRRFHEKPLVVPKKIWLSGFIKKIKKGRLPSKLKNEIQKQRETGYPLLIFAPEITMGETVTAILQREFPEEEVRFVSSQTEERLEIVTAFRKREIGILVSTTILERGVTFPGADVFVLEANHRLYTKSALIQMSGRVGRSKDRPTGLLYFFQDGSNKAIEKTIAEIKLMNREGSQ